MLNQIEDLAKELLEELKNEDNEGFEFDVAIDYLERAYFLGDETGWQTAMELDLEYGPEMDFPTIDLPQEKDDKDAS